MKRLGRNKRYVFCVVLKLKLKAMKYVISHQISIDGKIYTPGEAITKEEYLKLNPTDRRSIQEVAAVKKTAAKAGKKVMKDANDSDVLPKKTASDEFEKE